MVTCDIFTFPSCVYILMLSVPRIGSGSTTTPSMKKYLLKMNEKEMNSSVDEGPQGCYDLHIENLV